VRLEQTNGHGLQVITGKSFSAAASMQGKQRRAKTALLRQQVQTHGKIFYLEEF
jgi:hypothetical protein